MSRSARIDKKGYYYHLFARGQRKNPLYFSNDDMGAFLNILNQVLELTDMDIHAYAVIRNHYHLLVHRNNTSLAQFMMKLNTRYAMKFNNKYDLTGKVFGGRFGSRIVLEERELPKIANYVHYNPLKHGMTDNHRTYPFSSFSFYEGRENYVKKLKKIDFDMSMTSTEFMIYKDCVGTKEQYLKFLKRKPGRPKAKFKERRIVSLKHDLGILLEENGLDERVFHRHRDKEEKIHLSDIIITLLKYGYKQADIARELGFNESTIYRMIHKK